MLSGDDSVVLEFGERSMQRTRRSTGNGGDFRSCPCFAVEKGEDNVPAGEAGNRLQATGIPKIRILKAVLIETSCPFNDVNAHGGAFEIIFDSAGVDRLVFCNDMR